DRKLTEYALSLPLKTLTPGLKRKGLLRALARKYLPRETVDRPKMGFALPLGEWFRNDFGDMRTLLTDQLGSADPFGGLPVDREQVQILINEHLSGKMNHEHRLFALLTLSLWVQEAKG
ncbi:MAG TPA: hypothetical protein ENJ06_00625, partial [Phycisphaeraceae bacterium]|nr:hypothetical protein [Phycisphaeraceae bacterium]